MDHVRKIHFLGIGGSGLSGIAQIARASGFEVSGCDLSLDTPYIENVKKAGITVYLGHSAEHLQGMDLLAVSPAVFYQNPNHPELEAARRKHLLIKWQDFMGQYLHPGKTLIAVAGTHGKSTTAALAGLLLENANLDPMVEVGAIIPAWDNNIRIGQGQYFVSEADEFHDNFATFKPDIILLTLLEFDHPEYFQTLDNMLDHYQRFVNRLRPGGTLIYNADSPLISRLQLPDNSQPYHLKDFHPSEFPLGISGDHNHLNALAIIRLSRLLNIPDPVLKKTLSGFHGLHRRMELLGQKNNVRVYDDYANHPTAFAATIKTIKDLNPQSRLWAVIEPHTYSRLKTLIEQLPEAVRLADFVIVSRIFAGRETDPGDFTGQDIVTALRHPQAKYIPEFNDIAIYLKSHTVSGDIVLVMGSGNSYRLSRQILNSL